MDFVRDVVEGDQVEAILSILIGYLSTPDIKVWRVDNSRVYSVKSGNKLLLHQKLSNFGCPKLQAIDLQAKFFTTLWALQVPHKVKIHTWKIYNDRIPT